MKKVFIIAEAGVNHNGSLRLAKKLVDVAKSSGADAVKFQTFRAEDLSSSFAQKAVYQKENDNKKESQLEMLKKLELSEKDFRAIFSYCKKKRILFLSTPFDMKSADFLFRLGLKMFKISSGDLNNIPFLLHLAAFKRRIMLSTGMSDLSEVREAVSAIRKAGNTDIVLLHCTSNYPARFEDANLRAMDTLRRVFSVPVGYSDHTIGIEAAVAAAALGADVIEKHFTLDKKMKGPDHKASLEPDELKEMVSAIRNVGSALGDGKKSPAAAELKTRKAARKSLVPCRDIKKGEVIGLAMISVKRPGTGIEPKYLSRFIGKKAKRNIISDRLLKWEDIR